MNNETIFHVMKDPVHGTMQFTTLENNWIKPFIDSPNFQRLRHIKQLGMGDFIFPGAVHTRFNHCLGCCYIASQIAQKIGLREEERQLVMIACLLHDIGHGPFSHTFEDLFRNKTVRHEAWTPYFLADYRTPEFFNEYNRQNPRHPLSEDKFTLIEEMIMHKSPIKNVLADIVSSQLDADRLDYLLRDSHFCGVTYGEFDFAWMLNSMAIIPSVQGKRLGLTHKGIGGVEHYLMARRLMTRNIYLNQKKLALEFFLIKLLQFLAENLAHDPTLIAIKNTRLGNFLLHVDQFNKSGLSAQMAPEQTQGFLLENYPNYKELCDYDVFSVIKSLAQMESEHPAVQMAKRLQYRQMPKIIRLDPNNISYVEKRLVELKNTLSPLLQEWQIALIQTPHQSYSVEADPILIINENNMVKPLNEISLMINAMGDKLEHTAFLCIDKAIHHHPSVQKFVEDLGAVVPQLL